MLKNAAVTGGNLPSGERMMNTGFKQDFSIFADSTQDVAPFTAQCINLLIEIIGGFQVMGGYGSSRWKEYKKQLQVEDCFKLSLQVLNPMLRKNVQWRKLIWTRNGRKIGEIECQFHNRNSPYLQLVYTVTKPSDKKVNCDYQISLKTTKIPWGNFRYWFVCPNAQCQKRASVLYLTPDGIYFACRHCYRLSYRTKQDGYVDKKLFTELAEMMADILPGVTWRQMKAILEH